MALLIGSNMPLLTGATGWITEQIDVDNLLGCPTIIQFWAISCPICKRNIPLLQELLQVYHLQGLRIVSIHMPRIEEDMDIRKIKDVVRELNLVGPCAIDNQHIIGNRFHIGGIWPTYFLFDATGRLRSRAAGEWGIKMAENSLKRLLELSFTG